MLGEVTHLQTISEDLKALTSDPHKLPPASEQVRKNIKKIKYSLCASYFCAFFFFFKILFTTFFSQLWKKNQLIILSISGDLGLEGLRLWLVISNSALIPQHHHVQEV